MRSSASASDPDIPSRENNIPSLSLVYQTAFSPGLTLHSKSW
jgi:hypothetical protein